MRAGGFSHTVFDNGAPVVDDGVLHVYLEGDGTPWRHRTVIMPDPTPRRPLMLGLMALDPDASVYVGRPCYNGTYAEPGCDNRLWTSDRYSERGRVEHDERGAPPRRAGRGAARVRLFGHSGGAALALLIAERLPTAVDAVLTLAGNLDTDAWTTHHGYSPLYGSINPAGRAPLAPARARVAPARRARPGDPARPRRRLPRAPRDRGGGARAGLRPRLLLGRASGPRAARARREPRRRAARRCRPGRRWTPVRTPARVRRRLAPRPQAGASAAISRAG